MGIHDHRHYVTYLKILRALQESSILWAVLAKYTPRKILPILQESDVEDFADH